MTFAANWPGIVAQRPFPNALPNKTNFSTGVWTGWLSPFGSTTGSTQTMYLNPASFPAGVQIRWTWPSNTTGVVTWDAIDYGDYEDTVPPVAVTPAQVKNVTALTISPTISLGGFTAGFDVIMDLWLTAAAGDNTNNLYEVEIFFHTPAYSVAYANAVTQIGQTTISGILWNVSVDKTLGWFDILCYPVNQADILNATIDINAFFQYFVAQSAITGMTGNEYFNGLGFGLEVQQLSGYLEIQKLAVNYTHT